MIAPIKRKKKKSKTQKPMPSIRSQLAAGKKRLRRYKLTSKEQDAIWQKLTSAS